MQGELTSEKPPDLERWEQSEHERKDEEERRAQEAHEEEERRAQEAHEEKERRVQEAREESSLWVIHGGLSQDGIDIGSNSSFGCHTTSMEQRVPVVVSGLLPFLGTLPAKWPSRRNGAAWDCAIQGGVRPSEHSGA